MPRKSPLAAAPTCAPAPTAARRRARGGRGPRRRPPPVAAAKPASAEVMRRGGEALRRCAACGPGTRCRHGRSSSRLTRARRGVLAPDTGELGAGVRDATSALATTAKPDHPRAAGLRRQRSRHWLRWRRRRSRHMAAANRSPALPQPLPHPSETRGGGAADLGADKAADGRGVQLRQARQSRAARQARGSRGRHQAPTPRAPQSTGR